MPYPTKVDAVTSHPLATPDDDELDDNDDNDIPDFVLEAPSTTIPDYDKFEFDNDGFDDDYAFPKT
jgi:hypothetical protein